MENSIPPDPASQDASGGDKKPLVPYRLTICGLAELERFCRDGVTHVLSILDPEWPEPEPFAAFDSHHRECFYFDDVIAVRAGARAAERHDIERLLRFGETLTRDDVRHLLVHCHAGVSRSTAAAAILMAQHNPGRETEAFERIAEIRPRSWPNSLLVRMADDVLDRRGALTAALAEHHRRVAERYPDLAALIRLHGRAHEVLGLSV